MEPLWYHYVLRHLVELDTSDFCKESLNLVARNAIKVHITTESILFSQSWIDGEDLTEFRLKRFLIIFIPRSDEGFPNFKLILLEHHWFLHSVAFLLDECLWENSIEISSQAHHRLVFLDQGLELRSVTRSWPLSRRHFIFVSQNRGIANWEEALLILRFLAA